MKKLVMAALLALAFVFPAKAVCPAGPPTLQSPANNVEVMFGNVMLNWSDVAGATSYQVFVGIDGDAPSLHDETTNSQLSIAVEPGRTIQWKVGAVRDACATQYSGYSLFTTACPTARPLLQEPDRGERFTPGHAVTFDWTPTPGATSYDVRVTPDFGQTFETIAENITPTQFTTDDLPAGDWGWHVRVNFDGDCEPLFSEPSNFLITNCAQPAPQLVAPANNASVTQPFTLQWSDVDAEEYEVYVEQANSQPVLIGSTEANSFSADGLGGGAYAWFVVAKFPDCPDVMSNRRIINVQGADGECPANPGKATLVAPAANANNLASPVTFDWNPVAGARGYRVLAAFGNGEAESLGITDANTTQLTVKLPTGTGVWLVQTFFGEECPTTLSDRRTFTVTQGASCPTAAPQLLTPPNGAAVVESPAHFSWTAVPDAAGYALFVNTGGDDFSLYGTTDADTTELERLVPEGLVRWFVAARFTGCPETRSPTFSFGTDSTCVLGPVQITTPAPGADVNSPVTVSWNPVPTATGYRLTLKSANGANVTSSRTTDTSATLRLPAGTFFVRVEALREGCEPSFSEQVFTVVPGASCGTNAAPMLISPAGSETQPAQTQSPVSLTWNPVANAIGYRVFVARNDEPFEDVALTSQTSDEVELEPGRYRWFVQAFFEGCEPTRSTIAFFNIPNTETCTRQPPQIVAPSNDGNVTSPVTIDWNGVPGAVKYRILALVNDKPTLLGVVDGDDTELTEALIPGQYEVVVQAEFEECSSTESARTRFTVRRAQSCPTEPPQLASPANGAANVDTVVDFVWAPVSGAIEYAVIAKVNDGAETLLGKTNATQLSRRMPPGKITWSVIAILPGCDPLRAQPFTFTVARPQGCPDRKPVLLFPTSDHGRVPGPVEFAWLGVPGAIEYRIWVPQGSPVVIATTTETRARVDLPPGKYRWYVEARFDGCPSTFSAETRINVVAPQACGKPARPEANVIGQATSGTPYQLRWTPLPNVSRYEVQESTTLDFENAASFTSAKPSMKFTHDVAGAPVQYLYRVRGISDCNDERGPYSEVVGVFVVDPKTNNASTELGTDTPIVQKVFLKGASTPQQFSVRADKPWLTVTPSGGTLPVEGLTLTVTADPNHLGIGTNTATLQVTYSAPSAQGGPARNDETTVSLPLSVSLVTPVTPGGKGTPPPDALIFAAVGHASGVNDSLFESDIRLTNLTAQTMKYDLHFTPSGVEGTTNGISSTIEVPPGVTMALDDVVASAFGEGTVGSSLGMLEVRPLPAEQTGGLFGSVNDEAQQQLHTVASSRTYNFTPNGTFGQFIPATPFSSFVGRGTILSLQQVAQTVAYRANFGFLEASGNPVELAVRVYDPANQLLATIPLSLGAMQHRQMNGLLQNHGITLESGRVEVEVVSGDGKVTAYVSEVDNATNDPLLISPVVKGAIRADRYVVPGMASLNTGSAFWVSDLRIFNAGAAETPATLTFYPIGNPAGAITREMVIGAGEIKTLDNVLVNTFGFSSNAGGSIVITTPAESSLTATARTYNQTSSGTYGQFIPGVTVDESVGAGDRALQILQVEQSTRIRTNIGVNETSGKPATVEVSLITPDSLTTPVVTIPLQANEYRQFGLVEFGLPDAVYNGRVTVKVIGGEGKVTAYGSAIDQITQDPTYVPAQ